MLKRIAGKSQGLVKTLVSASCSCGGCMANAYESAHSRWTLKTLITDMWGGQTLSWTLSEAPPGHRSQTCRGDQTRYPGPCQFACVASGLASTFGPETMCHTSGHSKLHCAIVMKSGEVTRCKAMQTHIYLPCAFGDTFGPSLLHSAPLARHRHSRLIWRLVLTG